jgi:hypothetical protein
MGQYTNALETPLGQIHRLLVERQMWVEDCGAHLHAKDSPD